MEKILLGRLGLIENRSGSYLFEETNYVKKESKCYVVYRSLKELVEEVKKIISDYELNGIYMVSWEIKDNSLYVEFNDDGDELSFIIRHDNQIQR